MREFVETLWRDFQDLAESDFPKKAIEKFHACFWEMYVGVTLRRQGLNPERASNSGPDFLVCIDGLRIWIEATTAEAGDGADAVPPIPSSCEDEADFSVPHGKIALRITNAIAGKRRQFQQAIENLQHPAKESDALIVAINGDRIRNGPTPDASKVLPRALLGEDGVRIAVYPIGTKPPCPPEVQKIHTPEVLKANKEGVSMVGFLNGGCPDVSAAIYSEAHVGNVYKLETTDPRDWHLLHNPGAKMPIPRGCLSFVTER